MLRALDELAERLGRDGLPGRRLARATAAARATAWTAIVTQHGQLPAVTVAGKNLTRPATEPGGRPRPVLVIRLDATLIEATSSQAQAAGHDKGGLRIRILSAPARLVTHARRRILKITPGWEWSGDLATAWDRLQALHPV